MREKWAGTNLNRGYGHPKAEGYQATPPARIFRKAVRSFNLSESRGRSGIDPNENRPRSPPHASKYRSRCARQPGLNAASHRGQASSSGFPWLSPGEARLPEGLCPSLPEARCAFPSPSRYSRAVSVARKRRTAPPARRTGHGATARPRGRSRRRGTRHRGNTPHSNRTGARPRRRGRPSGHSASRGRRRRPERDREPVVSRGRGRRAPVVSRTRSHRCRASCGRQRRCGRHGVARDRRVRGAPHGPRAGRARRGEIVVVGEHEHGVGRRRGVDEGSPSS